MRFRKIGAARIALGLLLSTLLASSALAADARTTPLLGRWRSLKNDAGGIGSLFEFREGGAFDYTPATVLEMSYRVEEDTLVLPPESKGGAEHRQKIDWLGEDRIRLSAPGTLSLLLSRKVPRPDAKKSIVGEWTGPRDMGGHEVQALYLFSPDGKLLLLMPFLTSQGRYTVDGTKIQLSVPDHWEAAGTFTVDGDTLTLSITNKKGLSETKYSRY